MRSHSTKKINRKLVLGVIDSSMPVDEDRPGLPITGAGVSHWAAAITDRAGVGACGYQAIFEELEKLLDAHQVVFKGMPSIIPDDQPNPPLLRRATEEEQLAHQKALAKEAKRRRITLLRTARSRHGGLRNLPIAKAPTSAPRRSRYEVIDDHFATELLAAEVSRWPEFAA